MGITRRNFMAATAAIPLTSASLRAANPSGLTFGPDATVLKEGKPYRGVGINYYDCFCRTLKNHADTSYQEGFQVLADHGVPFVRFACTASWPIEMRLYREDSGKYFSLLDGVVRTAEKHRIGLIPSMFWSKVCVPDLVGEPGDQWGNPDSKTQAFIRQYVHEVVGRYRESAALWAWEFGNEFDSYTDMPNAATFLPAHNLPKTDPKQGTPAKRTPRDFPKTKYNIVAFREFAKAVRRDDPYRLIDNGCSITGKRAWHYYKEQSFSNDSPEQFEYMLNLTSPDPVNLISIHCYQDLPKEKGFWRDEQDRLDGAVAAARNIGKPLFVGEFSPVNDYAADSAEAREAFEKFLDKMDRLAVPLAAAWVFDYPPQEADRNITATNKRAWQFPLLRAQNEKLARGVA
ncbi:MAG: cellulase family glycosylhydrolase [Candidatus Solibacter sp.]|jgi:hypothetical protein